MSTPPLLSKMLEVTVGDLIVRETRIVEPRTNCTVARNFPSREKAIAAAREMNEVADWVGVLKTRAEGKRPNCQAELRRIAETHGGSFAENANVATHMLCAAVVESIETAKARESVNKAKEPRTCVECGKPFVYRHVLQKTCSSECSAANRDKVMKRARDRARERLREIRAKAQAKHG